MAKTTVPGLYIADGAITAAKLSSSLDLSGVTITVATASTGDNDTTVASTAFVQQEIAALVDSSPSALNTLNELAAAIGDDASFSTTVTNSIATKLPLAGGTMTGDLIINTTGSLQIPVGTTAQRPTAAQGQLRFNTTTSKPEIYNGSAWADVGGGVESVNSATGVVVLTTANIAENTNLYYTDARADARIAAADTDDLSEGSTNLYFTTARANSAIDGRLSGSTGVTVSNGAISIGQDVATSTSPTFQNLTLSGTDSVKVPSGTTAQRSGSPANGMLRYNSSTNEFEGYANSAWGAIGGDTTSSVDLYTATGNGSTATYDTGKNPQSENNTWVFIGGVYQPKSTYSFSGTEITLSENLPNGEDLEVITGTVSTYNPTDAILGQYNVTTSNTASYDTSLTTENENNVFVFIDGVYQPKSSYTYSGSTLTLDAVPTSGMSLEVLVTRSMNAATVTTGFLADDAVTTAKITDANVTAAKLASSLDLTGKTVTVATASAGDNDTSVASTAFVRQEITSLVDSAPAAMDTLNELAAALGDDANFSTTVNASIAAKLPLAGGTMTGNITLGDNNKAIFGVSGDLQIYHDGSNSYIKDLGTGDLFLSGNTGVQIQSDAGENMITTAANGGVSLFYDASAVLATTSTGIDVTGTATMDGLTVDATGSINFNDVGENISSPSAGILAIESRGSVQIYGDSNNNGTPTSAIFSVYRDSTYAGGTPKSILNVTDSGDISFYNTAGTSQALFWDASAESLGIATTSPTSTLDVLGVITSKADGAVNDAQIGRLNFTNTNSNASSNPIRASILSGRQNSAWGGYLSLYTSTGTDAASEKVRIGETGNVGIGMTPTYRLDVTNNSTGIQGRLSSSSSSGTSLSFQNSATNGRNYRIGTNFVTGAGEFSIYDDTASAERMTIDSSGNVGIGVSNIGSAGLSLNNSMNFNISEGANSSFVNIFRQASSAATVIANGYKYTDTANKVASSYASSWAKSAIALNYGNTIFYNDTAATTAVGTDVTPTERMRIDSSGNVVIGATSANSSRLRLDNGGTSGAPQLMLTATGASTQTEIRHDTSNNLIFENWNSGRTERMRIDSSGDVRIGSITNAYGFAQKLRVGDGDDNDGITINSGSTHQGNLAFCHGAGGNTAFGRISYQHNSNYMAFFTNNTERMRIDSSGDVLMGNTTVNPASAHSDQKGFGFDTSLGSLEVAAIGGSAAVFGLNQSANTDIVVFRKQGTQRGSVYISDGGTTYNTSSDARLKNVLGEAKGLEIVNKLNAVNFEWKESKEIQDGLIAQEVEELIPHAVSKNADGYYQMDYSMVVTPLIKAIQEQQTIIDDLKSRIETLEG